MHPRLWGFEEWGIVAAGLLVCLATIVVGWRSKEVRLWGMPAAAASLLLSAGTYGVASHAYTTFKAFPYANADKRAGLVESGLHKIAATPLFVLLGALLLCAVVWLVTRLLWRPAGDARRGKLGWLLSGASVAVLGVWALGAAIGVANLARVPGILEACQLASEADEAGLLAFADSIEAWFAGVMAVELLVPFLAAAVIVLSPIVGAYAARAPADADESRSRADDLEV